MLSSSRFEDQLRRIGLTVEVDVDEALSHYYRTRVTIFSILGFTLVLSVGILHFGKDGIVLDCSGRHAELKGSTREKIIGMNLREEISNDELRAAVFGAFAGEQTEFEGEYTSFDTHFGEHVLIFRQVSGLLASFFFIYKIEENRSDDEKY
jgi:PAS domain-containing protein